MQPESSWCCPYVTTFSCFAYLWYRLELRADWPHPRGYSIHRQTLWTDNDSSLLFAALGKAQPLISTTARQKFYLDLQPWPQPLTLTFKQGTSDVKTRLLAFALDLWPTTLTYSPSLAKVKVDPHTKNQDQRSNDSAVRALTSKQSNTQMDRHYQVHYLPTNLFMHIPYCFEKFLVDHPEYLEMQDV